METLLFNLIMLLTGSFAAYEVGNDDPTNQPNNIVIGDISGV